MTEKEWDKKMNMLMAEAEYLQKLINFLQKKDKEKFDTMCLGIILNEFIIPEQTELSKKKQELTSQILQIE